MSVLKNEWVYIITKLLYVLQRWMHSVSRQKLSVNQSVDLPCQRFEVQDYHYRRLHAISTPSFSNNLFLSERLFNPRHPPFDPCPCTVTQRQRANSKLMIMKSFIFNILPTTYKSYSHLPEDYFSKKWSATTSTNIVRGL